MPISTYVQHLLHTKQSFQDERFYNERAHLTFKDSGPSWLDLYLPFWPPHDKQASHDLLTTGEKQIHSYEPQPSNTLGIYDSTELLRVLRVASNVSKFFFIRQKNSRSRLDLSRELFDSLCEECDIFEKIRGYALCFGIKGGDIHVNPPSMQFWFPPEASISSQRHLDSSSFEIAYILRSAESNNRVDGIPWSIRQACVYQQSPGSDGPHTWLFIALPATLETQLNIYLSTLDKSEIPHASEIHFVLFDAAISSWRGCILYFAEIIQKQSDLVLMAQFEVDEFTVVRLDERQYLKKIEDSIVDIVTALSFMLNNLDVMIDFQSTLGERGTPSTRVSDESHASDDELLAGLRNRKTDLQLLHDQARTLQRKVQSISSLVSDILDLNNGNALKVLAIETRTENANMAILTKKSVQDAATVKILTIVTLVYLPLTVVTNFFSTSFVATATAANGTSNITVTSDIWILFAVGVPLTLVTIYIWWIFAQKETEGKFPGGWEVVAQRSRAAFKRPSKVETGHHHHHHHESPVMH